MPTIFIIGDSTVIDSKPPYYGWGGFLPEYVREGVTVRNHAISGRSSRSFWEQGRFASVEEAMSEGDMLLIQFGHNDEKSDDRRTEPDTTFPEFLWRYCEGALARGALPVLVTPVCRCYFLGDGDLLYTHGEYARAIRVLAAEKHVPLCDLKQASRELFLAQGPEKTAELFLHLAPGEHPSYPDGHDDQTHFCAEGARVIAGLVARELRKIPECAAYLKEV